MLPPPIGRCCPHHGHPLLIPPHRLPCCCFPHLIPSSSPHQPSASPRQQSPNPCHCRHQLALCRYPLPHLNVAATFLLHRHRPSLLSPVSPHRLAAFCHSSLLSPATLPPMPPPHSLSPPVVPSSSSSFCYNHIYRSHLNRSQSPHRRCRDLPPLPFLPSQPQLPPSVALAPCFLYHCSHRNLLLGRTLLYH
ncbi:hypothetical protein BHM03_00011948 [Ensete ventricosum]|uniref:Uncharacterized protein n=1 Tax=Ensete ventricosum TaxID=4639 RepID=A0A445MDH4_ENSVE|nr:hypothetical protein BHM03_00011948 [Ensete ventricosum]